MTSHCLCEGIKITVSIVILAFQLSVESVHADDRELGGENFRSNLDGNRFLVVTPEKDFGQAIGQLLEELYQVKIVIKTSGEYTSFVDEEAFNAFIYLGSSYYARPDQKFIDDMERTGKQVLWINYHGWEINEKLLATKGLAIKALHDYSFTEIEMQGKYPLAQTDTTVIETEPENVIYWLHSPSSVRIPGAVSVDNFTFVSYLPDIDVFSADFEPFLAAIRAAFGNGTPPHTADFPEYEERINLGRNDGYRTGIHLPVYVRQSDSQKLGYEHDRWHENLVRIKQTGAEWVNLVMTYFQSDIYSSDVAIDEQLTPSLESIANIVKDAHDLNLMVQLHLAINLKNSREDDWHGMIRPRQKAEWWARYRGLVLEAASFSKENEVEALSIGTEFSSLQRNSEDWRSLITAIQEEGEYPGLIGYSANFNALDVPWSEGLDFFGISAYWPLSKTRDPDLETLDRSWSEINQDLEDWMQQYPDARVEFTEVGYVSQPYSSVLPFSWRSHRGRAQSLTEQQNAYLSLYRFLKTQPKIEGVHIFASTEEDTEPGSIGYTPFGKPAEAVVNKILQIR